MMKKGFVLKALFLGLIVQMVLCASAFSNDWEGLYAGDFSGTGGPIVTTIDGEWSLEVESNGDCTFIETGLPLINQVTFTGSVDEDGSFFLESYVLGVGYCSVTGVFNGDNQCDAEFGGKMTGYMEFTVFEDGSIEGITVIDSLITRLFTWQGSGELTGEKY